MRFERWKEWSTSEGAIDELVEFIGCGGANENLAAWARMMDFPYMTVLWWLQNDRTRLARYNQAREFRAERIADEIAELADEPPERQLDGKVDAGSVRDKQLRIETRKWLASKLYPRRYSEKVAIGGSDELPPIQTNATGQLSISPAEAYQRLVKGES